MVSSRSARQTLCGLVAVVLLLLAVAPRPAAAYYQGACVKQPVDKDPKGVHYQIRIPHGKTYADKYAYRPSVEAEYPGNHYFDALRSCHPHRWQATYDREGNAHLDFVLRDRKFRSPIKNRCDVAASLSRATRGKYTAACAYGGGEALAETWRTSWKDEPGDAKPREAPAEKGGAEDGRN